MSRIKWRIITKNVVSLVEIKDAYCVSIQSIVWVLLQLQPDFNDNATVTLNRTFFIHSKCAHMRTHKQGVALEGLCSA